MVLEESPLGKRTGYIQKYAPKLLYPIPRKLGREKIGVGEILPFHGQDLWNSYELSWLNLQGKPQVALGEFFIPCSSPFIIESKSFKLYLNSFNQTSFHSSDSVRKTIEEDISQVTHSRVLVKITPLEKIRKRSLTGFQGVCLDGIELDFDTYQVTPKFLSTEDEVATEEIYSNLLKSNCLATGQPDWGSVFICYTGRKIDHHGLLRYIVSYRNHSGFAEHCVEQMFEDVMKQCRPERLTVAVRYTRRGGLDINPFRSNFEDMPITGFDLRQ